MRASLLGVQEQPVVRYFLSTETLVKAAVNVKQPTAPAEFCQLLKHKHSSQKIIMRVDSSSRPFALRSDAYITQ